MFTDKKLVGYNDFEHIMIHLAGERGWEFKFAGEHIPVQNVFNHSTYAPALLTAAQAELDTRQLPCDLSIRLEGENNSLFGARVSFDETRNSLTAQFWRLAATAMIVESLAKSGNYIDLDPLQYVLGDSYAAFINPEQGMKEAE